MNGSSLGSMKGTLIRSESKCSVEHCSSRFWDRCVLQHSGNTANDKSCTLASHCTQAEFSDATGLFPARGRGADAAEEWTEDKPGELLSCIAQDMWASYWVAKWVTNNVCGRSVSCTAVLLLLVSAAVMLVAQLPVPKLIAQWFYCFVQLVERRGTFDRPCLDGGAWRRKKWVFSVALPE